MPNPPPNGLTMPHAAGVAGPSTGPKDPCRHRRNAKTKKQKFVVYKAEEEGSAGPTGRFYIGRTRGATVAQAKNTRERNHHRKDIGGLEVVCVQDTYSACRGAEQKHYDALGPGKRINTPRKKGRGKQIAPIREGNEKVDDYLECAKKSAENAPKPPGGCSICAAP
jgi:hypothetical protein